MAQAKRIRIGKGGKKKPTMTAKKPKTITVTFGIYCKEQGDGSALPRLFESKTLAQLAALKDDGNPESTSEQTLVINVETGEIISGVETWDEDAEEE